MLWSALRGKTVCSFQNVKRCLCILYTGRLPRCCVKILTLHLWWTLSMFCSSKPYGKCFFFLQHILWFRNSAANLLESISLLDTALAALPGWGFARGLASLVENAGTWPSAEHGGPRAFPLGEVQINVRVEEPGVWVLFHQAVDLQLGRFEAAHGRPG